MSDDDVDDATRLVSKRIPDDATRPASRADQPEDATRLVSRSIVDGETRLVDRVPDDVTRLVAHPAPDDATRLVRGGDLDDRTIFNPKVVTPASPREIPLDIPNGRGAFVPDGVSDAAADRYVVRNNDLVTSTVTRTGSAQEPSRRTPVATRKRRSAATIVLIVGVPVVVAAIVVAIALVVTGILA